MAEMIHRSEGSHMSGLTLVGLKEIITNILPETKKHGRVSPRKPLPIGAVASPLFINCGPQAENKYDEVLKNIYLGDRDLALDKEGLQQVGITHILNTAQGKKFNQIDTDSGYYSDIDIKFMGVRAVDFPNFKMQPHFQGAANFIAECLDDEGKVYIHCRQGLSRSATLLLAYIMIKRNTPLIEAVSILRKKRPILPNDGFLKQLIHLNDELFSDALISQTSYSKDIDNNQELSKSNCKINHELNLSDYDDNMESNTFVSNNTSLISNMSACETKSKIHNCDNIPTSLQCDDSDSVFPHPNKGTADPCRNDFNTSYTVVHKSSQSTVENNDKANVHQTEIYTSDQPIQETSQKTHQQQIIPCKEEKLEWHEDISSITIAEVRKMICDTTPEDYCSIKRLEHSRVPLNKYDEVYPGIYLGNSKLAKNKVGLQKLGITHVLNAAFGKKNNQIDLDDDFYSDIGIKFMGVPAGDHPNFKMYPYFQSSADYIFHCVDTGGKIYIFCQRGMSRSATLLLAFLMIKEKLKLLPATRIVRKRRPVLPNDGFLRQLKQLDKELFFSGCPVLNEEEAEIDNNSDNDETLVLEQVMDNSNNDNDENIVLTQVMANSNNDKKLNKSTHENDGESMMLTNECAEKNPDDKIDKFDNISKEMDKSVDTHDEDQTSFELNKKQQCYSVDEIKQIMRDVKPELSFTKGKKKDGEGARLLFVNKDLSAIIPCNRYDEVYPGIWLGGHSITRNMPELRRLGITHIVNTAQGNKFAQIDTSEAYYADIGAKFFGINAMDTSRFQMINHFYSAADFIDDALQNGGTLYVHCHQGFSRSAAVTLAFLMIKRNMRLIEAITTIRKRRAVMPNDGFIAQLIELEDKLKTSQ